MKYEDVIRNWRLNVEQFLRWGDITYDTYLDCMAMLKNPNFDNLTLKQLKDHLHTYILK